MWKSKNVENYKSLFSISIKHYQLYDKELSKITIKL